jgi:hypothetical protein
MTQNSLNFVLVKVFTPYAKQQFTAQKTPLRMAAG